MIYNFTFTDFIKSSVAQEAGINNMPAHPEIIQNWFNLVTMCLQPARDILKKPMVESSGYRCKALNSHPKIRGKANSQHLTGQALDFTVPGMRPAEVVAKLKASNLEYDQLINEYDSWVHLSFNKGKNRKQCFKIG